MSTSNEIYSTMTLSNPLTEGDSSPEDDGSVFDDADILGSATVSHVANQLATAGQARVAASAVMTSTKKRRRLHSFEMNPSIRKRQQTRLLRKLCMLMEEYISRVGQQAVIVCCTPGKSRQQPHVYRVIGSQPLENVIRGHKTSIMCDLEVALSQQPPLSADSSCLFELPSLTLDGVPTPLNKMTQAQLRGFIPEMMRYSTGKNKPGWGKPHCKPPWWPDGVPWANVRSDIRDEESKKNVPWTLVLRQIIISCYQHHGRSDLLQDISGAGSFTTDVDYSGTQLTEAVSILHLPTSYGETLMQAINNPDGSVSLVQLETNESSINEPQYIELSNGQRARIVNTLPTNTVKKEGGGVMYLTQQESNEIELSEENQMVLSNSDTFGTITLPACFYQSVVGNYSDSNMTTAYDRYQVICAEETELINQFDSH